jgi:hypothetical protein
MRCKSSFFARRCVALVAAFLSMSFITAAQQTGEITGRVVIEGGAGLSNVTVRLFPANTGQRSRARLITTATDEEGNFKFTSVPPAAYSIAVLESKGYVNQPVPAAERNLRRYYRLGDHAIISLIRGAVITGRVTTSEGEPMVGVVVSALMARDAEGNPLRQQFGRQRLTDDRGVYRLYGLSPGTYIVVVRSNLSDQTTAAGDSEAPTYYPSSTRDTAGEVAVVSGGEASGIDIRFRSERGRTVSGIVTGMGESLQLSGIAIVSLFSVATGNIAGGGSVEPGQSTRGFAISGVTDGEYEIVARRGGSDELEGLSSTPRRLTVKGGDVTGIELKLLPQASITGKLVFDGSATLCEPARKFTIEESVISLRRDEKASEPRVAYPFYPAEGAPTNKGDFILRNIDPGRYFIEPRLPVENWYVKSIAAATGAPAGANSRRLASVTDVARAGLALKSGEKLSGLTVTIANGAGSIRGKVVAASEGARLPARVRIHLAPAETSSANDLLRYAEANVRANGEFSFTNLAPGKYWLLARPVPDDEPVDRQSPPVAWDANGRAELRKEAEGLKVEVELKPCQRIADQIVRFGK